MTTGLLTRLYEALQQFWGQSPCTHSKISTLSKGQHCPDCGEHIVIAWQQLLCVGCNSKRLLKHGAGAPQALETHCRHCGESATAWIAKPHVEPYEVLYSVVEKIIAQPQPANPSYTYAKVDPPAVQDATVIYSTGYCGEKPPAQRKFFKASPYNWTTDSKRPLRSLTSTAR